MRTCRVCGESKPLEDFVADRRYREGRRSECRGCFTRIGMENRRRGLDLPEKATCTSCGEAKTSSEFGLDCRNDNGLRYRCLMCSGTQTPEDYRNKQLRLRYGITGEEYDTRLAAQGGGCAVCGTEPPTEGRKRFLAVDHCHDNGTVRGLLCDNCNTALGMLGDDVERILALAAYLKNSQVNG